VLLRAVDSFRGFPIASTDTSPLNLVADIHEKGAGTIVNRRTAAKRDVNEAELISLLRCVGASVVALSEKGVPDLLVWYKNRYMLIEVKTEKGKLSSAQKEFVEKWKGPVYIARNSEDVLDILAGKTEPCNPRNS